MKRTIQKRIPGVLALLTVLCLLAGCASGGGAGDAGQDGTKESAAATGSFPAQTDAPASTKADEPAQTDAPASTKADEPAPSGEPEGWEEEWPEEYPVTHYRLQDGAIRQTGSLNRYRYLQLDGAETYMDLAADYVREVLACGDNLTMREDSPHDGYANWLMDAPNGSATISGSSVTGRFVFNLYPGFDRILEMTEAAITDRSAMEQSARAFVGRFCGITGELELVKAVDETQSYHDERSSELRDVTVPAVKYTFRSGSASELRLAIQEGTSVPVTCGDSTVDDLRVHCFTVTVWPDLTVVSASNYITLAQIAADGTARMADENDVPALISYLSSMTENDTVVIEEICADSFSVYFGYAAINPVITVNYYFESDPDNHLSTDFSGELFENTEFQ